MSKQLSRVTALIIALMLVIQGVWIESVAAAADSTAPMWVSGYPKMGTMTQTTGHVSVESNESGKVYCVVLPAGADAPLSAEVKAGTGKNGSSPAAAANIAVSANSAATINLSGLTDVTMYDAYLAAEDNSGNLQQTATKLRISTSILAHFSFEGNVSDDSGNGNNGTAGGSISYAPGYSGQALSLNGSSYLNLPYQLLWSHPVFSVTMRFKTQKSGSLLGYQNTSIDQIATQYIPIIYIDKDGYLRAELWRSGSGGDLAVNTGVRVTDNVWHKITMTATASSISIYVDNSAPVTNLGSVNPLSMYYNQIGVARNDNARNATAVLSPPTYTSGSNTSGDDYFTGQIDDVYILSEGIDNTSVAQLTSDAPKANTIHVTNNPSGTGDTVTAEGLAPGDTITVYSAPTGGTALGSSTVASGGTSAAVTAPQLGTGSGSVYVSVTKSGGTESGRTQVSYISEDAQAANTSIAQAKSLLPDSFTAAAGTDTNLLTSLNAISGMSGTGVTLSLASYNSGISSNGDITYSGTASTGNVIVYINKPDGTQDTKTISVTLTANLSAAAPTISSEPSPATANIGGTATFTAGANSTDGGQVAYQWQKYVDGVWTNVDGATDPSYTTGTLSYADNGSRYRCEITNKKNGTTSVADSSPATLTVNPPAAPTVNKEPSPVTATIGGTATFTADADSPDGGTLSYQWQVSADGGKTFTDISGATSGSYTTEKLNAADDGKQFRCIITNSKSGAASQEISTAAALTVNTMLLTVNNEIDALPNPTTASDQAIIDNQASIVSAKNHYDALSAEEKNTVGKERQDKLNELTYRLNALLVIIPKDQGTGIVATNLGTSVEVPELNDSDVSKVVVKLVVDPLSGNSASSGSAHAGMVVTTGTDGKKSVIATYDISLFKSVFDTEGNQVSYEKISNSSIKAPITILIPIPAEFADRTDLQMVYIDDAGNATELPTTIVTIDGVKYLQFTTTHFSVYAIAAPDQTPAASNPKSGDTGSTLYWCILLLAGSWIMGSVIRRKKKGIL